MQPILNFDSLTAHLLSIPSRRKRVAVACPHDSHTAEAVEAAINEGFADFILVGRGDIIDALPVVKQHPERISTIAIDDTDEAARKAVALVRAGEADVLMKGLLNTDNLLRAVLDKENGLLPRGRVLSHITASQIPGHDRLLFFSDAAVIPFPTPEQRAAQVGYMAEVVRAFGIECPRIALIHCSEKSSPKFPVTADYAALKEQAAAEAFGCATIDGPMDVKTACDPHSGAVKGIVSPINGQADAMLMPDIESGNVFYKTLTCFAGATNAGMLVGTSAPVVLPSRSDPPVPNSTASPWHALQPGEPYIFRECFSKLFFPSLQLMRLLTINPGSTSTKIAVFDDTTPVFTQNIRHSVEDLAPFELVSDQFEYRRDLIVSELEKNGIPFCFDAIVARGGLLKPIEGGVYEVNRQMLSEIEHPMRNHACNLGCRIAYDFARRIPGCRALTADPGVVDELEDVARISGSPIMPRITTWHALNQRSIARRYAAEHGTRYENLNLIIAHLGGGISVGTHRHGRCIDVNNAFDGEGPFSPERAGSLPPGALIDLCYSQKYTREQLKRRISGNAGLAAHLGTTDVAAIVESIKAGDKKAELVLNGMIYSIAKWIGGSAVVLKGQVDAILLTGGVAYSDYVIERLSEYIGFIAPISVYPGENEMLALAANGLGALQGTIEVKEYK